MERSALLRLLIGSFLALSLTLRLLSRSSLCAAVSEARRSLSLLFLLSLLSEELAEEHSCTEKVFEGLDAISIRVFTL